MSVLSRSGGTTSNSRIGVRGCPRVGALTPRCRRARMSLIVLGAVLWCGIVISRLVSLQITEVGRWREWAERQHLSSITIASERGQIVDREGRILAVSVPAGSIYVRPKEIKDRAQVVALLSSALNLSKSEVASKIDERKPFIWIERQVPRATAEQIAAAKVQGIGYVMETKRYYPYQNAASALIGRVGIDGNGLSGIERRFESRLKGSEIETVATRDAFGNLIHKVSAQMNGEEFSVPKGDEIRLTLDANLQTILEEELQRGKLDANAKTTMGVLVDAHSGEILAMGQSPTVNLNTARISPAMLKHELRNLIAETSFEPGSIMKPLVAAAALDLGVVKPTELIDCEKGRFSFGSHVIKDAHPSEIISFSEVIVRSSNIGMSKVAVRMGAERVHSILSTLGFGATSGLRIPGEAQGILRSVSGWAKVDVATHSFGQGVAVTPLQMVRAFSALANGGMLPGLRLVQGESAEPHRRVFSERVATKVRDMLFSVVEDEKHGTGTKAAIHGIRVGGKTGTAQKAKVDGRGYAEGAYVASFVGFADAEELGVDRTLALIVLVDEPDTDSIYGGTLAAPVFKRIMQRSLYSLGTRNELDSDRLGKSSERGHERLVHNVVLRSHL